MKKVFSFLASLIIVLSFCTTVYAADVTVSAEKVNLLTTESTMIPVKTNGNGGIMGFKITVEYPEDKVEIVAVSRGELTSKGNFNTNLGMKDGTFDVLWNNTQNVSGDGTLFVITAQAKNKITKDAEIKLLFSQPDTFNENYKDVVLNCKKIVISADEVETTTETQLQTNGDSNTNSPSSVDSSQVMDAVQIIMDKYGYDNLTEVEDEKQFVAEVNRNLEILTGTDRNNINDMDALNALYVKAYEDEFVTEITDNIDSDIIDSAIEKALKTVGAKSIDDIKYEDKTKFVTEVEKNLKEEDADVPNISSDLETDDAISIIKKAYNSSKTGIDNTNEKKTSIIKGHIWIIVISIIAFCAVASSLIFIVKKKRKQ